MFMKNEKYRQILFLILIIGCTIVTYSTWYFGNGKRSSAENKFAGEKEYTHQFGNEMITKKIFNDFIKHPNSKEGVNSLFNAIVRWELEGKKDSVQYALKEFETVVKNDSLKNSLYNRLGQLYISSYIKLSSSSAGLIKRDTLIKLLTDL